MAEKHGRLLAFFPQAHRRIPICVCCLTAQSAVCSRLVVQPVCTRELHSQDSRCAGFWKTWSVAHLDDRYRAQTTVTVFLTTWLGDEAVCRLVTFAASKPAVIESTSPFRSDPVPLRPLPAPLAGLPPASAIGLSGDSAPAESSAGRVLPLLPRVWPACGHVLTRCRRAASRRRPRTCRRFPTGLLSAIPAARSAGVSFDQKARPCQPKGLSLGLASFWQCLFRRTARGRSSKGFLFVPGKPWV